MLGITKFRKSSLLCDKNVPSKPAASQCPHLLFTFFKVHKCSTEICVTKYNILSYVLNKHAIIDYLIFCMTFRCTVHGPFCGLVPEQRFDNLNAEQYIPFFGGLVY